MFNLISEVKGQKLGKPKGPMGHISSLSCPDYTREVADRVSGCQGRVLQMALAWLTLVLNIEDQYGLGGVSHGISQKL